MAPLILHNVPDEELYVGDDGVQRPYAMLFSQQDGHQSGTRGRRAVPESGSFGKSARRSRSKTGTPAKREDPTIQAADKVFSQWFKDQNAREGSAPAGSAGTTATTATASQRKASSTGLQPAHLAAASQSAEDVNAATSQQQQPRFVKREPTEVVLRGFRSPEQQYAAVSHYEQLAGRICEDYARDPPAGSRRYKSELRDPALTQRERLTPEERARVNRAAGGEHWVKVTFESAEAADAAVFASPQSILGCFVYAEPYMGVPPRQDGVVRDRTVEDAADEALGRGNSRQSGRRGQRTTQTVDDSQQQQQPSPPQSQSSSRTADTNTATSTTMNGSFNPFPFTPLWGSEQDPLYYLAAAGDDDDPTMTASRRKNAEDAPKNNAATAATTGSTSPYCRLIPSARRIPVMPAEQALLPQPSYAQRALGRVPFLRWFTGSMIGNEVPRTDAGDFDWHRASLYWKVIWWLDATFGLFGGEILSADKED